MIQMFVNEWFRLLNYCSSDVFDAGIFSSMHDNYAKAWKKLDTAQQGEISYRIAKQHKEDNGIQSNRTH